ncbi:hypothetical protein IQ260_10950 [Leptolyngbya cf. ectocarpi LEGE 11479]|uniref:Uncharacterized protein n=1 Tax=Leptolyngbya cf. ectocarpi LEGE 11479 TaxID=1828722 RepID=A0A928X3Z5_LEPEC|nr:hypothetical protein [Leptolyngbya ectocarpi]MBE9067174.1 hypothetical protein [Leptolyngbya cf. ectocarpi LEGE 11479]
MDNQEDKKSEYKEKIQILEGLLNSTNIDELLLFSQEYKTSLEEALNKLIEIGVYYIKFEKEGANSYDKRKYSKDSNKRKRLSSIDIMTLSMSILGILLASIYIIFTHI